MKEMTRDEIVEKLVNYDVDTILDGCGGSAYVVDILREGFKGYNNYTKEELYQEHIERFNEEVQIK